MIDKYKVDRGIRVKRSQLIENNYNPNKTTEVQQNAIAQSLNLYGQLTSVLVRPHPTESGKYLIIDGEHRSKVLTDDVYVDVIHDLSEADARKLTIIMNETRGSADETELSSLLASLGDEMSLDELSIGLPYDETELQDIIKLANIGWVDLIDVRDKPKDDESWEKLTFKMPESALGVFQQAINLIRSMDDLHSDDAIALGQVIERLAADFIAGN